MWYEAMVKVDEGNETPQLSLRSRLGEIEDCLDLALEGGNALAVDVMTEKVELLHTKDTFVWIHNNAVGRKTFENCVGRCSRCSSGVALAIKTSSIYTYTNGRPLSV